MGVTLLENPNKKAIFKEYEIGQPFKQRCASDFPDVMIGVFGYNRQGWCETQPFPANPILETCGRAQLPGHGAHTWMNQAKALEITDIQDQNK